MRVSVEREKGNVTPFPGFQRDTYRDTLRGNTASPSLFNVRIDGEALSNSRRIARYRAR
jgi:hypothetical protein